MADALQFSVDTTSLSAGIRALTAKIDPGKMASAMAIGFEILRLSSFEVPHDKGSLQNSGTVEKFDDYVVVGYHEPYAARLHEHPEYHFQGGRKGKYLSDPIVHNAPALGIKFGEQMDKELQ